jgi:hypothetical protein
MKEPQINADETRISKDPSGQSCFRICVSSVFIRGRFK